MIENIFYFEKKITPKKGRQSLSRLFVIAAISSSAGGGRRASDRPSHGSFRVRVHRLGGARRCGGRGGSARVPQPAHPGPPGREASEGVASLERAHRAVLQTHLRRIAGKTSGGGAEQAGPRSEPVWAGLRADQPVQGARPPRPTASPDRPARCPPAECAACRCAARRWWKRPARHAGPRSWTIKGICFWWTGASWLARACGLGIRASSCSWKACRAIAAAQVVCMRGLSGLAPGSAGRLLPVPGTRSEF